MRDFIIIGIFLIIAIPCAAALSIVQKDGAYQPIQGFAPAVGKDIKLTAGAKVVDMSDDIAWQVPSVPSGCSYKNTSTTTNVGFYKSLISGTTDGRVVNHRKHGSSFGNHTSAFTIFFNCTSAILERQ
jgi:hypothetical protein